jgi:UDP-N-acetylmuramoyl-tripeptide--D-alanyl-D-alanine ligase
VLKTPESYNTLMGVCKVIRGSLLPEHDFFVVEMGAYRRKSIARLCRLTPPFISVLTTIGLQHLERFRSVENIKLAKAEILEALPPDGVAVLNGDNSLCREVEELARARVVRFGLEPANDLDVRASDVRSGANGLEFLLHARGRSPVRITSQLLGRPNVMNILAATAVALEIGLSPEEVRDQLRTLTPVPHRLQTIAGAGGVTIIDDAYNANPEGAIAALETLREFSGRKILITPGLVELGEKGFEENKNIGELAARVCDQVLLVGPKQTFGIQRGLREGGFDGRNLRVFVDSQEAIQHLKKIARPGDVILFENDLPDQYDERLQGVAGRYVHDKA